EQVLINLLLNAIQALAEIEDRRGFIHLQLSQSADRLVLLIDDNGPGIGSENPEQLFELYRSSKSRGSGLGLPLCRTIMQRFGGSIELSSNTLGGTRVRLQFRRAEPPSAP
ncbi:MAG: sensor histidine kinase, partial [Gammaproteobacteria bacterium]|nr:sensor histidine kinase [Gammaproteobacteria bacterium]